MKEIHLVMRQRKKDNEDKCISDSVYWKKVVNISVLDADTAHIIYLSAFGSVFFRLPYSLCLTERFDIVRSYSFPVLIQVQLLVFFDFHCAVAISGNDIDICLRFPFSANEDYVTKLKRENKTMFTNSLHILSGKVGMQNMST